MHVSAVISVASVFFKKEFSLCHCVSVVKWFYA